VLPIGEQWLYQAIVRDVSERRRIETALRHSVERLDELYRLAVVLGDRPVELAEHVVRALSQLLDVPLATVERLDGDELVVVALLVDGTVTHEGRFALAGTPCETVRHTRRECVFRDAASKFTKDDFLRAYGIRTYVGVPILDRNGEAVGVVNVMDREDRTLREEDVRLLFTFAAPTERGLRRGGRRARARGADPPARRAELRAAGGAGAPPRERPHEDGVPRHDVARAPDAAQRAPRLHAHAPGVGGRGGPVEPAERGETLGRMLSCGHTLADLVEDTLSVLRLEAGAAALELSPLALGTLFDELREPLRPLGRLEARPGGRLRSAGSSTTT
jgi:hypothetical protein